MDGNADLSIGCGVQHVKRGSFRVILPLFGQSDKAHGENTRAHVDDSSLMRKMVEGSLRQAGIDLAQVREAGNGAEARGILKEGSVDLILCDINMPVMDGLEVVRQLPRASHNGWSAC